jgi:hypothetical protein
MEREVALIHIELSWLSCHLMLLDPSIGDLGELIQLNEELTEHLLLDWSLISLKALDLVPELDLQRFAKHQLDL